VQSFYIYRIPSVGCQSGALEVFSSKGQRGVKGSLEFSGEATGKVTRASFNLLLTIKCLDNHITLCCLRTREVALELTNRTS